MNIYSLYGRLGQRFRARRLQIFLQQFRPTASTTILDVGGYPWFWLDVKCEPRITLLNPHVVSGLAERFTDRFEFVVGDGCALPYPDKSFDIVFSNSVIEHLGSFDRQRAFASEARRVGRSVWIQTPAREFLIEPHLLAPFIHWLPPAVQRKLLRHFTIWGLITKPSESDVASFIKEVRLMTRSEMERLFPGCLIQREKFLWFTKSYIAIHQPGPGVETRE